MCSKTCWSSASVPGAEPRPPEPAGAHPGPVLSPPAVVEGSQRFAVGHVLTAVEQGGDALRVDLQRGHLIPQPLGHGGIGPFELGGSQLAHQQEHQLLLLAFGKGALKGVIHRFPLFPTASPLLGQPQPFAKHRRPARVDRQPAAAGVATQPPRSNVTVGLGEPGSELRWQQLQQLRRGLADAEAWIQALVDRTLAPEPDLLAALIPLLDRSQVERLLAADVGCDPAPLLEAALPEWPSLAARTAFREAWLEPLLHHSAAATPIQQLGWLQLLGLFREPRVAQLLRRAVQDPATAEAALPLLPLLGWQRQPQDGALLMRRAVEPGPLQWRHQALEGLALGLSAWPQPALASGLRTLTTDLDAAVAAKAVDLLARLPAGADALRQCLTEALDSAVLARVQRRLRCSPLVLLVHGRQGGHIPRELQQLAADVAARRGAPVLLQALTAPEVRPDPEVWSAAQQARALTLVPLLLLPGGHVRSDLPRLARHWQSTACAQGVALQRRPFLGAWPAWQAALAQALSRRRGIGQRRVLWLHHPLQGQLPQRFVGHLSAVLGCPAVRTPYETPLLGLADQSLEQTLLLPLTLAANRLSETLDRELRSTTLAQHQPALLPPLLAWSDLRRFLLTSLVQLP